MSVAAVFRCWIPLPRMLKMSLAVSTCTSSRPQHTTPACRGVVISTQRVRHRCTASVQAGGGGALSFVHGQVRSCLHPSTLFIALYQHREAGNMQEISPHVSIPFSGRHPNTLVSKIGSQPDQFCLTTSSVRTLMFQRWDTLAPLPNYNNRFFCPRTSSVRTLLFQPCDTLAPFAQQYTYISTTTGLYAWGVILTPSTTPHRTDVSETMCEVKSKR